MDAPVTAKAALLQALISGDGFGLELIERVRASSGIALGQGSVYPALRSLENEGFVRSYEGESTPERGGRPRRYYRITAQGRRAAYEDRKQIQGILSIGAASGELI